MKVIPYKNMPTRPPIGATAIAALVLDRLHAPGEAWGAVGGIVALFWILWIVAACNQEQTDIWPDDKRRGA